MRTYVTSSLRDLCEFAEGAGLSRADVVSVLVNASGDYVLVYYA